MDNKKISLFSCTLMGIGSIIGASIFATTPIAIKIVGGNGIVLGFIFASIFVFLKTLPEMVLTSALPANGASYMHLTRLVNPYVGILHAFNQLIIGPMKVATMALTFSTYFKMLFPASSEILVAVIVTLIFTIISLYGIQFSAKVQNIMVGVLLAAIGTYIVVGWGNTVISLQEVITSTFELSKMWAAFVIGTLLTAVLYAAMAYVTIGVMPNFYEIDNLATVAEKFMSPALWVFFIAGGALLAVVTSINSAILMFSRSHFAAARDGLFPESIMKVNKNGAPSNSIWQNSIIAILAMISGFNLNDVINITSIPGLLLSPIIFASVFVLPKRFPNSYKTSFLKIPHWINCLIVVVASALSILLGSNVLKQMHPKNYIAMIIFYILAAIYTTFRIQYLKNKKGIDMIANMKTPYEPWIRQEQQAAERISSESLNS